MNELEWLSSSDPAAMLRHLTTEGVRAAGTRGTRIARKPPLISPRQLRLFACACCRQVWPLLTDTRSRRAVEIAERYADGLATEEERRIAHERASKPALDGAFEAELAWRVVQQHATALTANNALPRWFSVSTKFATTQAALLRCVAGNPWLVVERVHHLKNAAVKVSYSRDRTARPGDRLMTLDEAWLTPTVLDLATAAYENRGGKCGTCGGDKTVAEYGPPKNTHHCGVKMQERRDTGNERDGHWPVWCPKCWWTDLPDHIGYKPCPDCHGDGTDGSGLLSHDRLRVLSDALEEAGCHGEECELCDGRGHRGKCRRCRGIWNRPAGSTCPMCPGSTLERAACECVNGIVPHPLLAHLRDPGPHCRGCWAMDLLLGKE